MGFMAWHGSLKPWDLTVTSAAFATFSISPFYARGFAAGLGARPESALARIAQLSLQFQCACIVYVLMIPYPRPGEAQNLHWSYGILWPMRVFAAKAAFGILLMRSISMAIYCNDTGDQATYAALICGCIMCMSTVVAHDASGNDSLAGATLSEPWFTAFQRGGLVDFVAEIGRRHQREELQHEHQN